jgi:hypothetical protein
MDEWHAQLAQRLVAETPSRDQPAAEARLEIAFGQLRGAVAYVFELARAHHVVVAGHVAGDDVWLQLGSGRVRFTLNRRDQHIVVRPSADEGRVIRWDEARRALVDGEDCTEDPVGLARRALDALVAAWAANQDKAMASAREFEDEPTKG